MKYHEHLTSHHLDCLITLFYFLFPLFFLKFFSGYLNLTTKNKQVNKTKNKFSKYFMRRKPSSGLYILQKTTFNLTGVILSKLWR